VSKVISNLLQRHIVGEQLRGAGMPEGVGPEMCRIDTECAQSLAHDVIDGPTRDRVAWSLQSDKDLRVRYGRSDCVDVAGQGLRDGPLQRIDLRLTTLQAVNADAASSQIDLIHSQGGDLATTQTLDD
jgi:hypothetical protein